MEPDYSTDNSDEDDDEEEEDEKVGVGHHDDGNIYEQVLGRIHLVKSMSDSLTERVVRKELLRFPD